MCVVHKNQTYVAHSMHSFLNHIYGITYFLEGVGDSAMFLYFHIFCHIFRHIFHDRHFVITNFFHSSITTHFHHIVHHTCYHIFRDRHFFHYIFFHISISTHVSHIFRHIFHDRYFCVAFFPTIQSPHIFVTFVVTFFVTIFSAVQFLTQLLYNIIRNIHKFVRYMLFGVKSQNTKILFKMCT